MKTTLILGFSLLILASCQSKSQPTEAPQKPILKTGIWRATLQTQGGELPFGLEITKKDSNYVMYLINGEERLVLNEIHLENDSVIVPMHVFDAQIVAKIEAEKLTGYYQKLDTESEYKIAFSAEFGKTYRFENQNISPVSDISGEWKTTFRTDEKEIPALAQFQQNGNQLTGTFMTKTGDYRYLEGSVFGEQIWLSCFDGSHAYLFKAKIQDAKIIEGEFWSGKTGYRQWSAERDADFTLENPEKITFLKDGFDKIDFKLPSLADKNTLISPNDQAYKNKVVLIQILGSWCPNCMDETAFLSDWYKKNKSKNVAIIGMAFEAKNNFDYAQERIQKLKNRFQADFDFVFAGTPSEEDREKALPMLNKIAAFPTTIFIDKNGKVRKIHAGFSGPGTGAYYEKFKAEFDKTMQQLLSE